MAGQTRAPSTPPARSLDPLGILDGVVGGRFRITRCIGRGGMGVVYLARQEALDREVVVKLVRNDDPQDESATRFQREARSLSRLPHPNIVQVYDHGLDPESGLLFIAMEYIHGITLSRYLKRHVRLSVGEFRSIADQILAGVAEAHRHHLIHRDLKPSNVMLTSNDGENLRVKLLDFGLSKVTGTDDVLTQTNQMIGSAMYMAPEQLKGRPVDARADVYALGVLFYQMLSGTKPYHGDEPHQVFAQQIGGHVIPMAEALPRNHDVPQALIELVERCMSLDLDRRPPDACALQLSLNAVLASTPTISRHAALLGTSEGESPTTTDYSTLRENTGQTRLRVLPAPRRSRLGLVAGVMMGLVGLSSLVLVVLLLLIVVLNDSFDDQKIDLPTASRDVTADVEGLRAGALRAMEAGDYEASVTLLTQAVALSPAATDLRDLLPVALALRDRAKIVEPAPPIAAPSAAAAAASAPTKPVAAPAVKPTPRVGRPPPPVGSAGTGAAIVTSTPSGLAFRIGDHAMGTTPARLDLPIGTWPVSVFRDGEVVYSGFVEVSADEVGVVTAEIAPKVIVAPPDAPAAPQPSPGSPGMGRVLIESPDLYGEVLVNGTSYGFTPVRATIPVGPATIELKVGKAIRKSESIVVQEGRAHVVLR
jgi:tRNA A-37 threonylcarbamoyl transferase component Bud32